MNNTLSIKLYQTIHDANEPRVLEHWHASSIAECPRTHYFSRLGVPMLPDNEPSAAKMLRWKAGHVMEEAVREYLPKMFEVDHVMSNNRWTNEELDFTGEYDNYIPELEALVEIKTVHDYAFKEVDGKLHLKEKIGESANGRNKWGPKETPYLNHELQNHAYTILMPDKVKKIYYIYISLSGRVVVYETEVKQELIDNIKTRLKVLNEAWETQTPPPCICLAEDHPLHDPVMQWCGYRDGDKCCSLKLLKEEK